MDLNHLNFLSVRLEEDKCNGCINCMKRCPTEAIRVRDGKARIMYERCVGCGECINICPSRAKIPVYDSLSDLEGFKYTIAIPSPAVYGQFNNLTNINYVLEGLKLIGFNSVVEAAEGYEVACQITRAMLKDPNVPKPIIGSACPAVNKLLMMRYPDLLKYLSKVYEPERIAAIRARERAIKETGLKDEEIGVFAISPCVANVFSFKSKQSAEINGVLSFKDIYPSLLAVMNRIQQPEQLSTSGRVGISCGVSGGEAHGVGSEKYLAADGIENIIKVLDTLDREKLKNLDFVELTACASGCVGGVLNIENPFLAEARIRSLRTRTSITLNYDIDVDRFIQSEDYQSNNVFRLADNRAEAMNRLAKLDRLLKSLPGIDCGSCGAPSCQAFAEDIVKGIKMECKFKKDLSEV